MSDQQHYVGPRALCVVGREYKRKERQEGEGTHAQGTLKAKSVSAPPMKKANMARMKGVSPEALALDLMLENDGKAMLYFPFLNYAQNSLDPSHAMLSSPATIPGLSDGGAHVGMICDGSFPTSMLTHWTRDRTRGPRLSLAEAVKMQTADTAAWMGLHDRGQLLPGLRADLNVIDFDNLTLRSPRLSHDQPAGGRRLLQDAEGYAYTIVSGEVTRQDGKDTGARPGRLVRGPQPSAA